MILNVTLMHDEEVINPLLIDGLDVNLISGLGKRIPLTATQAADYIVVNIPWSAVQRVSIYSLEVKGAINGLQWCAIGKGLLRYTNATEAGADIVNVEADTYDVTMEAGYHYSDSPIAAVHVSVDDEYGTPSADVTYRQRVLGLDFHNLKGNGITSIEADEQVGDEAVNTVIFKTDKNPDGTSLQVRNGSRGNGIVSSSEELSPEDGGVNTFTFVDTDGNEYELHTKNGKTGKQGDSVLVGQGDLPLTHVLGQDNTKAMSQKGVTDAVEDLLYAPELNITMNISSVPDVNFTINGQSNIWKSNEGWYSKFIPIEAGAKYRITSPDTVVQFAFMTSDEHTLNATVTTYAEGITSVTSMPEETSADVIAPSDASFLYVVSKKPSVANVAVVIESITKNPITDIANSVDIINPRVVSKDTDCITNVKIADIAIDGNTNKWSQGWKSKFIPVVPGKRYRIVLSEGNTLYTFLTSDEYTKNTVVTTYAEGYSFINRTISPQRVVTAPSDAQFLWLVTDKGSGDIGVMVYEVDISDLDQVRNNVGRRIIINEGGDGNGNVFTNIQDAIDSCEDNGSCELVIEGAVHVPSTVTIPLGKKIAIKGGIILGSTQSLGLRRNDKNGIAKVYIGDLKPQWLMVDGVMRYPASTPRDYCYTTAVTCEKGQDDYVTITFNIPVDDAVKLAEEDISDVWVTILYEWRAIKLRIDSINTSTGQITCVYFHNKGSYLSCAGNNRIIIENINIGELSMNDDEDTWVDNTFYYSEGFLYYKYDTDLKSPDIEIPSVETIISSNGYLEMDNVKIACTSHIFDNLMGEGNGYRSFQSCFVINGAVEINGSAEIRNSHFYGTTNNSIVVKNEAYDVNIVNCEFEKIGGNAIMVGNLRYLEYMEDEDSTYIPNYCAININIIGNSIHQPGRIYEEASAIAVNYAQNFHVAGNVISDTYHTGISTGCDWASTSTQQNAGGVIEGNMLKNIGVGGCALVDGAAIYNLGNQRGMVIRKNVITGVFGGIANGKTLGAIYFDQGSANVTFENNVIYDVSNFIFINQVGSGISIQNNIFAFPMYLVTSRQLSKASSITGNIFVWNGNILGIQSTGGTYVGNLYWRYDEPLPSVPFDASAVIGNPNFRDSDNYDFYVIDDTYTSQINFENFTPLTPSSEIVRKASNNAEEEAHLEEWIESWNA